MGEERDENHKQSSPEIKQTETRSAAEPSSWATLPLPTPKLSVFAALWKPSMAKEAETKSWNTSKLGLRIGADALAASAAGVLVAPIITMIDKGIIENASGRNTLGDSLKGSLKELVSRPHRFLGSKPFALIYVRCSRDVPSSTSC